MSWSKLDDQFHSHPKTRRAWECRPALGLHAMALSYVADQLTDGFVDALWVRDKLPDPAERTSVIRALKAAGLWERAPGGWRIHDYLDFNPASQTIKDRRQRDLERKANARKSPKAQLKTDEKITRSDAETTRSDREREHNAQNDLTTSVAEKAKKASKDGGTPNLSARTNSGQNFCPRGISEDSALPVPVPVPVPVPLRTTTTPLYPPRGETTFQGSRRGKRQRDQEDHRADIDRWVSTHFAAEERQAAAAAVGLLEFARVTPTVEEVARRMDATRRRAHGSGGAVSA